MIQQSIVQSRVVAHAEVFREAAGRRVRPSALFAVERETGRIVSVTCPAAKDGAIVLENIPPIVEDFETCSPSKEYANSKVRTAAEHLLPT